MSVPTCVRCDAISHLLVDGKCFRCNGHELLTVDPKVTCGCGWAVPAEKDYCRAVEHFTCHVLGQVFEPQEFKETTP